MTPTLTPPTPRIRLKVAAPYGDRFHRKAQPDPWIAPVAKTGMAALCLLYAAGVLIWVARLLY